MIISEFQGKLIMRLCVCSIGITQWFATSFTNQIAPSKHDIFGG